MRQDDDRAPAAGTGPAVPLVIDKPVRRELFAIAKKINSIAANVPVEFWEDYADLGLIPDSDVFEIFKNHAAINAETVKQTANKRAESKGELTGENVYNDFDAAERGVFEAVL
jgi:hypothetical protein